MTDPFVTYMQHWTPTLGELGALESYIRKVREQTRAAYVIGDIQPFVANTGAHIEGRAQWRDHLKRAGCEEIGVDDLKRGTERHQAQKAAQQERLKAAAKYAKPVEVQDDFQPAERSRATTEVLNRLHGRPLPPRKELIKLSLDIHRRFANGRR